MTSRRKKKQQQEGFMKKVSSLFNLDTGEPSTMEESFSNSGEIIRQAFLRKGVPNEAVPVFLASLSKATMKQYSGTIWKWYQYCKNTKTDTFNPSTSSIITFLNNLFTNTPSYNTMNSHRSALRLIFNKQYDEEELVKRYLKGVFKLKPNFPKYQYTWDPEIVLNYLKNLYPLENLNLEQLTKKLLTLLALVTAHRMQTLSKIRLSQIKKQGTGLVIYITDLIKTSAPNRQQPLLQLKPFSENPNLCVITTLNKYIKVTQAFPNRSEFLFLTIKAPHKVATTQTLSRWLKAVLNASGVDTDTFTSHSARHASTSAASRGGLNIDAIRKTAGWTEKSLSFAKFYDRPLQNKAKDFADILLK